MNRYLQGELGTDGRSHLRRGKLNKIFSEARTLRKADITVAVPLFIIADKTVEPPKLIPTSVPAVKSQGHIPVLTVSKLGDWYEEMTKIRYPVQMADAIRDIAVNALWNLTHQVGNDSDVFDFVTRMKAMFGFVERVKDTAVLGTLGKMQIQPAAWASRHVRVEAITEAKKTARMRVEHLVYCDLVGIGEMEGGHGIGRQNDCGCA